MAEILLRARAAPAGLTPKQLRLSGKDRGRIIAVKPDGWGWGRKEVWPAFALLKVPGISVAKIEKYAQPQLVEDPTDADWDPVSKRIQNVYRARRWQIRWNDLPQGVKNKVVANNGVLTIKAGSYTGPSDYTWPQVKSFFRNLETDRDETVDP